MITIPIVTATDAQGDVCIAPAAPFPADAIAIVCNGTQYTVYQPGDAVVPVGADSAP